MRVLGLDVGGANLKLAHGPGRVAVSRPFELWIGRGDPMSAGAPFAMLVVSHRSIVLERADQVIVLESGRIIDRSAVASVG